MHAYWWPNKLNTWQVQWYSRITELITERYPTGNLASISHTLRCNGSDFSSRVTKRAQHRTNWARLIRHQVFKHFSIKVVLFFKHFSIKVVLSRVPLLKRNKYTCGRRPSGEIFIVTEIQAGVYSSLIVASSSETTTGAYCKSQIHPKSQTAQKYYWNHRFKTKGEVQY